MNENLWSYLHDGVVSQIEADTLDAVRIRVDIPHLRRLWADSGQAIYVTLHACETLYWDSYDTPQNETTTDMTVVEIMTPTILQVHWVDDQLVLSTECGDLVMVYAYAKAHLDTGQPITLEELADKSNMYWSRQ